MTSELNVAAYFSRNREEIDHTRPVIIRVDAFRLIEIGYEIERFEDNFWGEGRCAWEREFACWEEIPVEHVSLYDGAIPDWAKDPSIRPVWMYDD